MDITRSFIETAVDKAIRDIARDPERGVRNVVDLGHNFSRGRFQQHFLSTAQAMLADDNSAYYTLARQAVASIDPAKMKTFGINIGYNSFTKGAKTIRGNEASLGINIPWSLTIRYLPGGALTVQEIDRLIGEANRLGIFAFLIHSPDGGIPELARLMEAHPQSGFILFRSPGSRGDNLTELFPLQNLMVALYAEDDVFEEDMGRLREAGCITAVYTLYDDKTIEEAISPQWLEHVLPVGCAFAILVARPGTSAETISRAREYTLAVREGQRVPMFLMDYLSDHLYIDQVISNQSCFMGIDSDGGVFAMPGMRRTDENVLQGTLQEILSKTMPRVTYL